MAREMVYGSTLIVFFFNDTATTEIYTLSLHDALPISVSDGQVTEIGQPRVVYVAHLDDLAHTVSLASGPIAGSRSEEHTSELQSRQYIVCRLLLEKKKYTNITAASYHPRTSFSVRSVR